jgi:hypothetical protein
MNLRNYHILALRELKSRGLSNLLFEEEKDETESDSEEDDNESKDDSDDQEPEDNEAEEEIVQDPSSIDNQLDKKFIEFETSAIESAKSKSIDVSSNANESLLRSKKQMKVSILYEAEDKKPNLDIDHFANQIARFVMNYDSLIDMPQLIIKRAVDFLTLNYDEGTAEQFQDALRDMHDLEMISPPSPPNSKLGVPNAAGARQATS